MGWFKLECLPLSGTSRIVWCLLVRQGPYPRGEHLKDHSQVAKKKKFIALAPGRVLKKHLTSIVKVKIKSYYLIVKRLARNVLITLTITRPYLKNVLKKGFLNSIFLSRTIVSFSVFFFIKKWAAIRKKNMLEASCVCGVCYKTFALVL